MDEPLQTFVMRPTLEPGCGHKGNRLKWTPRMELHTPDGRYFLVNEQLWRCSNPALAEEDRQRLVKELMDGRRAVKAAKASADPAQMQAARALVQAAKVALGERGPVWWTDGAADWNRYKVHNTPYADWYLNQDSAQTR